MRQRPKGALAPSLRGLAKISDFRLGECPKYQRHPLSHGIRRDSSPRGGAKGGFAAGSAYTFKQQFTSLEKTKSAGDKPALLFYRTNSIIPVKTVRKPKLKAENSLM